MINLLQVVGSHLKPTHGHVLFQKLLSFYSRCAYRLHYICIIYKVCLCIEGFKFENYYLILIAGAIKWVRVGMLRALQLLENKFINMLSTIHVATGLESGFDWARQVHVHPVYEICM